MAIACDPALVLLDEPTTGLDVTTQAQILDLLTELRSSLGMAMLYVTHNLGVVAQICDRIGVMYAGHLVEVATRHTIFRSPRHPYTQGLIAAVPRILLLTITSRQFFSKDYYRVASCPRVVHSLPGANLPNQDAKKNLKPLS